LSKTIEELPMRTLLALILGVGLAANGLFMLADPAGWYGLVPGVPMTGPLNVHFVRDIGCAYAVAGLGLAARRTRRRRVLGPARPRPSLGLGGRARRPSSSRQRSPGGLRAAGDRLVAGMAGLYFQKGEAPC
jgi:hypothetical protein